MTCEMFLRRWGLVSIVVAVAMPMHGSFGQSTTAPTDAANQANVRVVHVVVGMNFVTIDGRPTPAEQLQTQLEAMDDRADAVLQLGYASDDVTIGWYSKIQEQIFNEAERKKLGFKSYSNVGLQPANFPGAMGNARPAPILANVLPIQRQDANSNTWWIHSRDAAAMIDSAGKGQPIEIKAINYNTYQFVPQDQRNLIFSARRISRDHALADGLNLTADQISRLTALTGTIGMVAQPADLDRLKGLWAYYQAADAPEEKLAVQDKLVNELSAIAHTSYEATKASVADRAAKIKAVLTDDQWKRFDTVGR